MILIFDLKTGNLSSIKKALDYLNIINKISDNPNDLEKSSKIILPGVGSFDNFMKKLKASELKENLRHQIYEKKKPFLGICLGMQILLNSSEEGSWTKSTGTLQIVLDNNITAETDISFNFTTI